MRIKAIFFFAAPLASALGSLMMAAAAIAWTMRLAPMPF